MKFILSETLLVLSLRPNGVWAWTPWMIEYISDRVFPLPANPFSSFLGAAKHISKWNTGRNIESFRSWELWSQHTHILWIYGLMLLRTKCFGECIPDAVRDVCTREDEDHFAAFAQANPFKNPPSTPFKLQSPSEFDPNCFKDSRESSPRSAAVQLRSWNAFY